MPLNAIYALLFAAGFFTGLYYVPIATFMQSRPPMGRKGEDSQLPADFDTWFPNPADWGFFRLRLQNPAPVYRIIETAINLRSRSLEEWQQIAINGMNQDFSWEASAHRYEELYREAMADRRVEAVGRGSAA